jgi:hypothetical protein
MSRGSPLRRKVAGHVLQKTVGRRYVSVIAGKTVIFRAFVRPSGNVRSWESVFSDSPSSPRHPGVMACGLANCVRLTADMIDKFVEEEVE